MARRKSRQFKKKKKPKVEFVRVHPNGDIENLQGIDKVPSTFDERWDEYFDAIGVESNMMLVTNGSQTHSSVNRHLYTKTNRKELIPIEVVSFTLGEWLLRHYGKWKMVSHIS